MGISLREYARRRGVSESAVRKAVASGRISKEPDGTIDPDKADIQWDQNTNHAYNPNRKSSTASFNNGDPTTYQQAKTANEVYKAQTAKLELDKLRKTLVDRSSAENIVFKLARAERDAWINWPTRVAAEMAAKLSVEETLLYSELSDAVRKHLLELGEMEIDLTP